MHIRSVIVGTGSALPPKVVTNADLAESLDTSDDWIRARTGIRERHVAAPGVLTSDIGVEAARKALDAAGLGPDDIDLVIVATATPDDTFPATATAVQAKLGIHQGAAFDVAAVCTGFIYALTVGDAMLRAGQGQRALVVGAELYSRILDWEDRGTAVLFGDGAGAVVLEAREARNARNEGDRGILAARLHSDGRYRDMLYVDGGPASTGTVGKLRMRGREVFKHAVLNLASVAEETLAAAGIAPAELDWVVPHQANARIIEATARRLGLPPERMIMTVARHANTSAASVPLAFDEAVRAGQIRPGDLCLLEAMGGGFTWGAVALRY